MEPPALGQDLYALEDQATAAQRRAEQERVEATEAAAQAASARYRAGGHN